MGSTIPRPIKQQVIRKWLEGKFRDKIAEELKISQGAVSNIIKDFAKDDPEFCLLREVALKIKNLDTDVFSFASSVRLLEVLREKKLLAEITEQETERLEALLVALEVFCFKENLQIEDFVGLVNDMYRAAGIHGVSLDKFPGYITNLEEKFDVLTKEVDQLKKKKQDALKDYNVTTESLEEYKANKPLIVEIQRLKQALVKAEEDLEFEKLWNKITEELEWSISEGELIRINRELGDRNCYYIDGSETLKIDHLKEMVREIYHRPSGYPELIQELIRSYTMRQQDRPRKATTTQTK